MQPTLFVSDVHLSEQHPESSARFLRFLAEEAPRAAALYILGDLFEYWAGDDDLAEPFNARIAAALKAVSERGIQVFFMHGNRDFLARDGFAVATGARMLGDPHPMQLHGTPTLLMHGDLLCTDDVRYQAFRAQVRNEAWLRAFLAKPLAERKAIIEGLRRMSEQETSAKAAEIMDVAVPTVEQTLRAHGYPRLIHGHTHRPARHEHRVDGHRCERWVLPDWYDRGGWLESGPDGCRAVSA